LQPLFKKRLNKRINMKKICYVLMLLACMMANVSCEEEDSWDAWVNKETLVVYEISCNTPGVPVELSDICYNPSRLTIKDYWRAEYRTTREGVFVTAECKDPDALIEVKIYANGVLIEHRYGNKWLQVAVRVKECYVKYPST
jgi:hypothetical protein